MPLCCSVLPHWLSQVSAGSPRSAAVIICAAYQPGSFAAISLWSQGAMPSRLRNDGCRLSGCNAVAVLPLPPAVTPMPFLLCCVASLVVADERRPPPQCSRYHLNRAPARRLTGSAAAAIWCVCTRACHFWSIHAMMPHALTAMPPPPKKAKVAPFPGAAPVVAAPQQPTVVDDSDSSSPSPPPSQRPPMCPLERHLTPAAGHSADAPANAVVASSSPPLSPPAVVPAPAVSVAASSPPPPLPPVVPVPAAAGGGARAAFAVAQTQRNSTCNLSLLPPSKWSCA